MEVKNYSISVELTAIPGAELRSKDDKLFVIIPVSSEGVTPYRKKDGSMKAYLGIDMWETRNKENTDGTDQFGNSHDLKLHYSKEYRESLPAGTYAPSIGRAKPIVKRNGLTGSGMGQGVNPAEGYQKASQADAPAGVGDMPF
jgi:hypothetical protein